MLQFASTIAAVVGDVELSGWMLSSLTITFVVLAPPVSQAADYYGRRWLLIILALAGSVGTIITSRATSVNSSKKGASSTSPLNY
jgi:MFS family permease